MEIPAFSRKSGRRRWKYPFFPVVGPISDGNTHFFPSLALFPTEIPAFSRRWPYFRRKQPLFRVVGLISDGYGASCPAEGAIPYGSTSCSYLDADLSCRAVAAASPDEVVNVVIVIVDVRAEAADAATEQHCPVL